MTFDDKINYLKANTAEIGCSQWLIMPPLYRLMLALGSKTPPPIFQSFASNVILFGSFFALIWSALMKVTVWLIYPISMLNFILGAIISGLLFGLFIALHLQRNKKRLGIGSWEVFWATHERKKEAEQAVAHQPA